MIRPLELFIGLRYTRAKRRNHFISFISLISLVGVALGVWALITVLSVMNGFEKELRSKILGVASHVTLTGQGRPLYGWRTLGERIASQPHVVADAPYVLGQGMLSHEGAVSGAMIRGVLPDRELQVAGLADKFVSGQFNDLVAGEYGIILGQDLAYALNASVGSKVTVITPEGQVGPTGMLPRLKRFTVVGVFNVGMYAYDSTLAFVHLEDAAKLYRTGEGVTGLRIKIDDVFAAPRVRYGLDGLLQGAYDIRDWTMDNANFFRALRTEKIIMFIILMMIILVAAFNIVSTLIMLVTDKQADIAILRTLGFSPGSIMGVFLVQGSVIGVVGVLLGGIMGIATALNIHVIVPFIEHLFGYQFLAADVYEISEVPSDMRWSDVSLITCAGLAMCLLMTLYPAWRASRTQPAEALRYE